MNSAPQPSPRQVAIQWFQRVWNERDDTAITQLMASNARCELEGGQEIIGPDQFRQFFQTLTTVFPDIRVAILDAMEEGEKATVRWEARGTHTGDGMGMRATNTAHVFRGMTWMVVRNGQIVDGGDCWNQDALLTRMAAAQ